MNKIKVSAYSVAAAMFLNQLIPALSLFGIMAIYGRMIFPYMNGGSLMTFEYVMSITPWLTQVSIIFTIVGVAPCVEERLRAHAIKKEAGFQFSLLIGAVEFIIYTIQLFDTVGGQIVFWRILAIFVHLELFEINKKHGWKKAWACHFIWNSLNITALYFTGTLDLLF